MQYSHPGSYVSVRSGAEQCVLAEGADGPDVSSAELCDAFAMVFVSSIGGFTFLQLLRKNHLHHNDEYARLYIDDTLESLGQREHP